MPSEGPYAKRATPNDAHGNQHCCRASIWPLSTASPQADDI